MEIIRIISLMAASVLMGVTILALIQSRQRRKELQRLHKIEMIEIIKTASERVGVDASRIVQKPPDLQSPKAP